MGCGNSTEGETARHSHTKEPREAVSNTTARSSETIGADMVDDRRSSIVPMPADPRKQAAYDPDSSATYERHSLSGSQSIPTLPVVQKGNGGVQQPTAAPSATNPQGYDQASEHRASYHRLLAAALPETNSERGSPTFGYRSGSPSYGVDGVPRSSVTSTMSGSVHMMPTHNLSMPFSPSMGDRQRASTASMLSNSTTSMPNGRPLNMGQERNLSVLSHTESEVTYNSSMSSTTKTASDVQSAPTHHGLRSASSIAVSPARGSVTQLPGSTTEGSQTPQSISIPVLNTRASFGQSSSSLALPLAAPINATQYPNTMYSYYPPVLGRSHHGLVTTSGKNALSTKTQTYTGKGYLKEYEHDMRKRAEWEEPLVADMLEGREMEKYKYRRRGQMPSLALPVDESMVQKEAHTMRHTNFSLSDAGPVKKVPFNNSRHQTTQDFMKLQIEDKMKSPIPGQLPGSTINRSPGSPAGFNGSPGYSSRHRREMQHAKLLEQQQQDANGNSNISNNPNVWEETESAGGKLKHQQQQQQIVSQQSATNSVAIGTNPTPLGQLPNGNTHSHHSGTKSREQSPQQVQGSSRRISTSTTEGGRQDDDVVLMVGESPSSAQAPASTERRDSGSTVNTVDSKSSGRTSSMQSKTATPKQQQQHTTINSTGVKSPPPSSSHSSSDQTAVSGSQPPMVPPLPTSAGSGLNILRALNSESSPQGSARSRGGRGSGRGDRVGLPELPTSARDATNPMLASHHNNKKALDDSATSGPLSGRRGSLHQQLVDAVQVVSARGNAPAPPQLNSSRQKHPGLGQGEEMPGAIIE